MAARSLTTWHPVVVTPQDVDLRSGRRRAFRHWSDQCTLLCRSVLDIASGTSGIAAVEAIRHSARQYVHLTAPDAQLPAHLHQNLRALSTRCVCERLRHARLDALQLMQRQADVNVRCALQCAHLCRLRFNVLIVRLVKECSWDIMQSLMAPIRSVLAPDAALVLLSDDTAHAMLHSRCKAACPRGKHLCVSSLGDIGD